MSTSPQLDVVMYHYVRELATSAFPRLKALALSDFKRQVAWLTENYEMATLESALAFLKGTYQPSRKLCLLTFDDGLKEHYSEVFPVLAAHKVRGLFFLITGCLEDHAVAPVHMNHFLAARLDWNTYTAEFMQEISRPLGDTSAVPAVDADRAARTYPWDTREVREFKYLFNFVLDPAVRDQAVRVLFERHLGNEADFARNLYLSWDEARAMQDGGMVMGGHTHRHIPLAKLSPAQMTDDLTSCRQLLDARLHAQTLWPFCYPYGKSDSFNQATVEKLSELGFHCSFTTESAGNVPAADLYRIRRMDCNVALRQQDGIAA